jgi:chromosomal replication initiator protein
LSRLVKYHGDAFVKVSPVVVIEVPPVPQPAPAPAAPEVPPIQECVSEIDEGPRRPTIQEIKKSVCQHFDITFADIESRRRSAKVVRPRQIVYYLCRRLTSRSLPEIARRLGHRDHTTALSGIRRIEKLIEHDQTLAKTVSALEAQFQ